MVYKGLPRRFEHLPKALIGRLLNFPILPSRNPTEDYEAVHKFYVDNNALSIPVRQTVLTGAVDGNNLPAIMTLASQGQTATLNCATTPAVITAAGGYQNTGARNYSERVTVDATLDLDTGAKNYIYRDLELAAWGKTQIAPIYSRSISASDTALQYGYGFNDGSGSAVDDASGRSDLATTGTATWGSGYLELAGQSGANYALESASNIIARLTGSFSVACWVEVGAYSANYAPFIGCHVNTFGISAASVSWNLCFDTAANNRNIFTTVSNGSSTTSVSSGLLSSTSTKYLVIMTYKRNGGSGDNVLSIAATADGVTWYRSSSTTAVLMQQGSNHRLCTRPSGNSTYAINGKYYGAQVFPDQIFTEGQQQAIYDAGSEAAYSAQDQHWYDVANAQMKYGNTLDGWVDKKHVFVSEAEVTGKVNSLLHFEGANGATTFTDEVSGTRTWTANADAQISTAQFKFGASSLLLDGTGDYISTTNIIYPPSSGAWTMEAWVRPAAYTSEMALFGGSPSNSFILRFTGTTGGTLSLYLSSNGSTWNVASGTAGSKSSWNTSQWYHIRVVFTGTQYIVTVDGVVDITVSSTATLYQTPDFWIGWAIGSTNRFNGYIDEFRYDYLYAASSGAFTPPVAAYTSISDGLAYNGVNYAYQGKYDSGVLSVSASTSYSKAHNIGTELLKVTKMERQSASHQWAHNHRNYIYNNVWYGGLINTTRLNAILSYDTTGTDYVGDPRTHGAAAFSSSNQSSGQARILVERGF